MYHFLTFFAVLACISFRFVSSNETEYGLKTLSFEVCNGFTNQRLSLLYGVLLAKESERSLVLPKLVRHGMSAGSKARNHKYATGLVQFSAFYSKTTFERGLANAGVRIIDGDFLRKEHREFDNGAIDSISLKNTEIESILSPNATVIAAKHVKIGCPFLLVNKTIVAKHRELVKHTLGSLAPSKSHKDWIENVIRSLKTYNMIHLRIENDWISHCSTWEDRYNNCLASEVLRDIGEHLVDKGFSTEEPLYIATDWQEADDGLMKRVRESLRSVGFDVRTKIQPVDDENRLEDREIRALSDYYLALGSNKFIGNSVSTFSALVMLERQFERKWSSYYNMGNIPLEDFLPFYRIPWVFTYSGRRGESSHIKRAVRTFAQHDSLAPFCIFLGEASDTMREWLLQRGVSLIGHEESSQKGHRPEAAFSWIFHRSDETLGALLVQLTTAPELAQFNYALYTSVAVLERSQVSQIPLSLFTALPSTMFMAKKADVRWPCSDDIVLVNLPSMRLIYRQLVASARNEARPRESKWTLEESAVAAKQFLLYSMLNGNTQEAEVCSISRDLFEKNPAKEIT